MPARCQHGSKAAATRKAAVLYLDDGVATDALSERFGLGRGAILDAVTRLRKERGL